MPVTLSDPTQSTEGLATLAVVRGLLGNPDGSPKPELVSALLRVGREALPSVRDAFNKVTQGAEDAPIFTASEQNVMANNRSVGERRVVASVPQGGDAQLRLPAGAGQQGGRARGHRGGRRGLREGAALAGDGEAVHRRRVPQPAGPRPRRLDDREGRRQRRPGQPAKAPTTDQVSELLRTWGAIALDSRFLAVLDVSGSMAEKMSNGQTRIEAADPGGADRVER